MSVGVLRQLSPPVMWRRMWLAWWHPAFCSGRYATYTIIRGRMRYVCSCGLDRWV